MKEGSTRTNVKTLKDPRRPVGPPPKPGTIIWETSHNGDLDGRRGKTIVATIMVWVRKNATPEYCPTVCVRSIVIERHAPQFKTLAAAKRWCERVLALDWRGL